MLLIFYYKESISKGKEEPIIFFSLYISPLK